MARRIRTVLLILLAATLLPGGDRLEVSGYYKNFSIAFRQPGVRIGEEKERDPDLGAVNNRIRIRLNAKPFRWMSFTAAYDLSPRIQDSALFSQEVFFSGLATGDYRLADLDPRVYPDSERTVSSFAVFQNLDRFFITLRVPFADLFVGRQPIAWGSARIVNPTDVIAPFSFNELDVEERRGVDALRLRIPLGMMDEIDIGFIAGKRGSPEDSAFYLRGKTYFLETDLSLLAIAFKHHLLFGIDISRAIGGAGFWFEAAYVLPHIFDEDVNGSSAPEYTRISIGMDTNLTPTTYGFLEYHFSSAGESEPENYLQMLESQAILDGSIYLLGRHYLGAGISQQISALISTTTLVLLNIVDGSFTLAPTFEYNIAQNIYLGAGAYVGIGKGPERVLGPLEGDNILPHSEFGSYPDMFYLSFRIYF